MWRFYSDSDLFYFTFFSSLRRDYEAHKVYNSR